MKYIVISLGDVPASKMPYNLQVWLNSMYEKNGYELIAIRGNEFIFKKDSYTANTGETSKNQEDFFEQ